MKIFRWSDEKNAWLKRERGISFDDIAAAIEGDGLLEVRPNPNSEAYPNQKVFFVLHAGYVHVVPFVDIAGGYFLKTIIPSRKATREWRAKE